MNRFESVTKPLMWFMALLLAALTAGCGGGGSPILGGTGAAAPPLTAATLVDVIKPRVTLTVPANLAVVAPANAAITATFTEAMAPATIIAANFTVVNTTVPGAVAPITVTYDAASKTAIFAHAGLTAGNSYTATITTAATDVAGNLLAGNQAALPAASNYVWTFTASAAELVPPTIILENPANLAVGVPINASVNATFSEAMNPATIIAANFTLAPVVAGVVTYDPVSFIATFNPTGNFAPNTLYTATVTVGATDMAGNALGAGLVPNPWTFTTGTGLAPGAIALGTASTFGIMATSAITSTGATLINGDVSLEPGTSNGIPPPQVNGSIHVNDTVSHQARADLLVAYNTAKGLAPGTTVGGGQDLGAFLVPGGIAGTLPPGTYTSGSTMLVSTPLTLDAGGNADAVWVFQIGSSLTTGANVVLANGAQAKNVFWVPTFDATIGVGTIFYGTLVAGRSVTGVTGSTINGRILAGATTAGTVALQATTVNVPAP